MRPALDSEMTDDRTDGARIGVIGCAGRVGRLVTDEVLSGTWGEKVSLAGGTVRTMAEAPQGFFTTDDPETLFARADVLVDFTLPDTTARMVWLAAKHHIPYVIGTTGLSDAQEQEIHDAAKETSIVYAANMSVGVTLLAALVEQAASRLGVDWDAEILETHHRHKTDAPSGTALMLGRATGREPFVTERGGKREKGGVGFAVRRGGDVVGEHTVGFYGAGERVELSHTATDRRLFARGAVRAALWAVKQKPGLYSMRDVLGI